MNKKATKQVVMFGNRIKFALIATADADGLPHVAASRKITLEQDGIIGVSEWFCPGTLANLQVNPRISIIVWDPEKDFGYQVLGKSERIEELAVMDGFSPELEKSAPIPQVERKIHVQADKVIHFSHSPHSDMEE
jgi:uncharacterized protein